MFSINSASSGQGQGVQGAGSGTGGAAAHGSGSSAAGGTAGGPTSATHSSPAATKGPAGVTSHAAGGASTVVVVMPAVSQASVGVVGPVPGGSPATPPPAASTPRCSKLDLTAGSVVGEDHCGLPQRLVANAWAHLPHATAAARPVVAAPTPKGPSASVTAARRLQRWVRRLQGEAQLAARARRELPLHLEPLLEAAAALGAGPWGCEWEALCSEERGLAAHAQALLTGLGLHGTEQPQDALTALLQPEALLSALLIAAHPEVVTAHMARRAKRSLRHYARSCNGSSSSSVCSMGSGGESHAGAGMEQTEQQRRKRRRQARSHAKKGEALAVAAHAVRDGLLGLHRALVLDAAGAEDRVPRWALARVTQQAARAVVGFVVRREHCRGAAAAETARLADELTGAVAGLWEGLRRAPDDDRAMAILAELAEAERYLARLVGEEEARGRIKAGRTAAEARMQHGYECEAAAAAVASAMDVVEAAAGEPVPMQADEAQYQQQQQHQQAEQDASQMAAAAAAAAEAGCPESLFSNEWLIHEICVLPPGRFLQVSLEDTTTTTTTSGGSSAQAYTAQAMGGSSGSSSGSSSSAEAEAYWASVTRTLLAGDATPLLVLVQELAERLISITPSRADLAAEVTEALDVALLEQVLARDLLDSRLLFSVLRFAGERVLWLEAPARNEPTQAWLAKLADLEAQVLGRGSGGPVRLSLRPGHEEAQGPAVAAVGEWAPLVSPLFEFLLEKVDQIHVDIFNSHVRRATPHCRAHGPAFERQRFQERLAAGKASLTHTDSWLESVLLSPWAQAATFPAACGATTTTTSHTFKSQQQSGQQQESSSSSPVVSLAAGLKANREDALRALLRRAYALLVQPSACPAPALQNAAAAVPEPLAMDAHRLRLVRSGLRCVARAATCVAYLSQALGRALTAAERAVAVKELMVLLPAGEEEEGEEGEAESPVLAEGVPLQVASLARRFFASGGGIEQAQEEALWALEVRVARMLAVGDCPVLRLFIERSVDALHLLLEKDGDAKAPGVATGEQAVMDGEEADGVAPYCRGKGLGGLEPWLRKLAGVLLLVCRHNEAAFASFYHAHALDILASLEAMAEAAMAAMAAAATDEMDVQA